ncbi:MAG: hypothetical protein KF865_01300 [Bdellovibrionaceae bacterium]|nr:hypothetical protein [Pseudobdellovibrionaceae bacterium]
MKKLSLSQMKILAVAALSLAMVMSFQNCAKTSPQNAGDGSGGDSDLLLNDPLKPAQSNAPIGGGDQIGALYHLVGLVDPAGEKPRVFTAGAFTLRFSSSDDLSTQNAGAAAAALDIVMKDVTFQATSGCSRQHIGMGRMARFKNLPLRTGALELKVSSSRDIATLAPCGLDLSAEDQSLVDMDAFAGVLESARAYAIQGMRLYFLDGQGRQAVFQRVDADAQESLKELIASWSSKTLLAKSFLYPDSCQDNRPDAQGRMALECKQLVTEKSFVRTHSFKLLSARQVEIQLACGPTLIATLGADAVLSDVRQKNPEEIHAQGCESLAMKESGEITAILSRQPRARWDGRQAVLTTPAGIQLFLE